MKLDPFKLRLVLAFAAVYTIWGSTYLAIRFGIETIPPFLMAGIRFTTAGILLYAWARWRGAKGPTLAEWGSAAIVGAMLLFVANGGITWAEQRVPSGITALLVATVPLWIALMEWLGHGGARPNRRMIAGLVLGLAGVALLIGPDQLFGHRSIDLLGIGVIMIANFSWAGGTLYSRKAKLPSSPLLATSMEMLSAGAMLLLTGALTGEFGAFNPVAVSLRSWLSVFYLALFGSIIGLTAYFWLLRAATPSRVSTYAYVNPVIALLLGWGLAGEQLTSHVFAAAGVIILAVLLIITSQPKASATAARRKAPDSRPAALVEDDIVEAQRD